MKFITPAVAALLATSVVAERNPGLGGAISQVGLSNAKNVAVPIVFKYLKDVKIPEIDISGGKFTNLEIKINEPALNNVNLNLAEPTNSVELKASGVSTTMTSDFKFKYLFVTASGQANISIKNIGIDVQVGLSEQSSAYKGDQAPKLEVQNVVININPDDVDIKLTGGAVAKIASVLVPLIKSSLIPQIVSVVEQTVKDEVANEINPDLVKYGSRITIPYLAGVTFDFSQLMGGPTVTSDKVLQMALDGTFYDANAPETYSITPAVFDLFNKSGKSFQGHLTDYVANTNFKAAFDTGNTLDITTLLYKFLKVQITTDLIGQAIPELLTKYGSGKAVSISGKIVKSPATVKFSSSLDSVENINLAVTIGVNGEDAIKATMSSAAFAGLLTSKSGSLFGSISQNTIGTVSDFSTTLGMTAEAFQTEFQTYVNTNIATLNSQLKSGIAIPTIFGINISDFDLISAEGVVGIGANVTPATFLDLQESWVSYKNEFDRIEAGAYKTQKWGDVTDAVFLQ